MEPMDFNLFQWLAETGTDEWVTGFIANNKYILGTLVVVAGGFLKGRFPDLWANIATAIPFVGHTKKY